jgi:hypothetical protein
LYKLWSLRDKVGDRREEYWKEAFEMKHLANFNPIWYKKFLHDGDSSLFKEGSSPLQRGDNHKSAKVGKGHLNIFSSCTTVPYKAQIYTRAS